MRLDLPCCELKDCRYYFDGNCIKTDNGNKPWLYEECPFTMLGRQWHDVKENPIEDKQYLCKVKSAMGGLVYYRCLTWNTEYHEWKSDNGGLVPDDIISWSEIKG